MIKKLSSALFGLLVIGSMVGCGDGEKKQETPISSQPIAMKAEINPAFLEWQKNKNDNRLKKSDGSQTQTTGYIPPLQKPTVHKPSTKLNKVLNGTATDSKFDLRDSNLVTSPKNQGECGACWAFASYGALESTILIDENITNDFSENHLKHNHGLELDPCSGGNIEIVSAYLSRANGPINESDDPYSDNSTEANNSAIPVRYIENIINLPVRANSSDNQYLKEALVEHGALYADIHIYDMGDATAENNYSIYNSNNNVSSDHAVLLVGWDDNYTAQGQTGAFIVKNSWGTDWGENGFFYVPYTDTTFAFGEVAYFNDTPDTEESAFDIVHDTAPNGAVTAKYYATNNGENIPIYGLSIYTIEDNQTIKSIGIHNKGDDTNISIKIFKDISFDEDGNLSSLSMPTDMETFNHIEKGWNTLQLQTPIELNSSLGQFAVQIIISENNGNQSYLPLDGNYTFNDGTAYSKLTTKAHQSFEGYNGSDWNDLFATNNSVAIKVFAQSEVNEDNSENSNNYQQELDDINTTLNNNTVVSDELRIEMEELINEIQELINNNADNQIIQDKFDVLYRLENDSKIDNTYIETNLTNPQIVELFGLEFKATNAVAKLEDNNGKLKITGYNRANEENDNVENIDINISVKEFNATLAFTPEANLNEYWPNAIYLTLGIGSEATFQDATFMIFENGIQVWLDENHYDDFNMTDFNISEYHNYGISLTDDNKTLFTIDGLEIFEANLTDTNFTQLNVGIRFQGKGVASIQDVSSANEFTPPLSQNDLDFINRVNEDIDGIIDRLNQLTNNIPTDLNDSIMSLSSEIQTLLESNPIDYELIENKLGNIFDYETLVNYTIELNQIQDNINNTANISQELNSTLQSLISDISSQLTLPLDIETIDSIFDSLREINYSYISEKQQEIDDIKTDINNNTNLTNDINTTVNTLINDLETLFENFYELDYEEIQSKIDELNQIKEDLLNNTDSEESEDNNNEEEANNLYGDNATIIKGTIVLADDIELTPQSECFSDDNNYQPLTNCNAVFIDLFDRSNEFLGSAMVQPDGNYTVYFKELDDSFDVLLKVHTKLNGLEESYYIDFGDDHAISNDDSFKAENELEWHEDKSTGQWVADVNYLTITAPETTLDLDLANKDADKFILSGTVQVPTDFTPGEIRDENGDWQGWNMVSLTAINTTTGKEYWTEIGKTETSSGNHIYPFSFKLPNTQADYIIRLEKMSDNNGAWEWIEMYLDDESGVSTATSDHSFDDDEALVSSIGVDWKDNGNGIWTPDSNKTGYFTVTETIENITIDITTYGANFKKIEGKLTPPSDFNINDRDNHIYIEIIDAKTGYWLNNVTVQNDGNYSILLGESINTDGYILKVNLEHWDQENWQDSYWKSFYLDFSDSTTYTFRDESEVQWIESNDEATGNFYWKPNVKPLVIKDTTTLNIDFSSYTPPATYKVSGTLSNLPESAKWVNIYLYDPSTYIGKNAELQEDNSFIVKGLKAGRYIMNIGYSDESDNYRYFDYLVVDDNGDFTSGTSLKDSMEMKWVPFSTDGTVIPESEINSMEFDWNSVAYWAPKETTTQKTLIELSSDLELGEISIPTPIPPSNLIVSLSGVEANKVVNFNLFVPNEPIGRWESNTSDSNGAVSINISDLKARDDYQLQIFVDGIEYWYNGTNTLTSDHYEGSGFTIDEGATKELSNIQVPNDKSIVTATLELGNENANKTFDVYMWQNIAPYNNSWDTFTADENGNIDVSLAIKNGNDYIMEIYNRETWNGFTVNNSNSLILAQNSWEENNGIWNPKSTILIDISSDLNLGTLTPPALRTVTFTLENLATDEDVWISLEDTTNNSWYGAGNADWSDWRNPTFSNSLSMQVPDTASTYYIYMFTMNHESGLIDADGDNDGHDVITVTEATPDTATIDFSNTGSAKVTWDSANADTINISNDTNISLTLKSTDDYKSIIGLVTLGDGDIEAGWMCANSPTNGNCGEVEANGTYEINGLSPTANEVYSVQYWANSGETFNTSKTWSDTSVNLTVDMDIASATLININGTVTDSNISSTPVETVLLDVNGTDWKVIDAQALTIDTVDTAVSFSFTGLAPNVDGHHYEIAVASTVMDATTGVTTYSVKDAIQTDGTETTTTISDDNTITIGFN